MLLSSREEKRISGMEMGKWRVRVGGERGKGMEMRAPGLAIPKVVAMRVISMTVGKVIAIM